MTEVPSPCANICALDQAGEYCLGCSRSLDEIAGWVTASESDKRLIVEQLSARLRRLRLPTPDGQ